MADFGMTEPPHATGGRLWRLELIATLLLGLSAVGAGWTAYQAARWSSDQTFTLDRANRVYRQAALMQNGAYLLRIIDVAMFMTYAQAFSRGNNLLADFLLERFRPPMKAAAAATSDQEIHRVYEERRLLARAFLANVVPVLAAALLHAFQLRGDLAMGAALAAICPGAPFGTFLALRTRGDIALAVILTCGLTVVALVTTPITSRLMFGPEKMVVLPEVLDCW